MDPIAHASIALIAKPRIPQAPLWALVAATEVPDLLCFSFFAAGIEHQADYVLNWSRGVTYLTQPFIPWSHGLFMCIVWASAVAALAFSFYRDRRVSLVLGLMVMSHWTLDFLVYPNIPVLFDHSIVIGLSLITSRLGFILGLLLEFVLIVGGIAAYWTSRRLHRHLHNPV